MTTLIARTGAGSAPEAPTSELDRHAHIVAAPQHVIEGRVRDAGLGVAFGHRAQIHDWRLLVEQIVDAEAQLPSVRERVPACNVEDVVARSLVVLRLRANRALRKDA